MQLHVFFWGAGRHIETISYKGTVVPSLSTVDFLNIQHTNWEIRHDKNVPENKCTLK